MKQTDIKVGEAYVTKYQGPRYGYQTPRLSDDPARWNTVIPLSDTPTRIEFTTKHGVPCAVALYHPELRPDPEWEYRVIEARYILQPFDDWLADMEPRLAAEKKSREEAEERRKKQEQELAEQQEKEQKLREILNNYGINDSDGWRGVNTKRRYSGDSGAVLTTYVRHLDLDDVLRLTGGKTAPPAKKKAKR